MTQELSKQALSEVSRQIGAMSLRLRRASGIPAPAGSRGPRQS
jgi:hypothetical protein